MVTSDFSLQDVKGSSKCKYFPVFNKCFGPDSLQIFKKLSESQVRPEVQLKSETAMQWKLEAERNSLTLNQSCWVDLNLNYVCSLSMYLAGKSGEKQRDEHWKVISHIPKFHFRVAEVPLFTGLWWRGALIATSCFSPSLFFFPLLVWEKSPDAVKWAMMTYVDVGLFISLWGL